MPEPGYVSVRNDLTRAAGGECRGYLNATYNPRTVEYIGGPRFSVNPDCSVDMQWYRSPDGYVTSVEFYAVHVKSYETGNWIRTWFHRTTVPPCATDGAVVGWQNATGWQDGSQFAFPGPECYYQAGMIFLKQSDLTVREELWAGLAGNGAWSCSGHTGVLASPTARVVVRCDGYPNTL